MPAAGVVTPKAKPASRRRIAVILEQHCAMPYQLPGIAGAETKDRECGSIVVRTLESMATNMVLATRKGVCDSSLEIKRGALEQQAIREHH